MQQMEVHNQGMVKIIFPWALHSIDGSLDTITGSYTRRLLHRPLHIDRQSYFPSDEIHVFAFNRLLDSIKTFPRISLRCQNRYS